MCDNTIWMVNWGLIGDDLITDKQAQKRPILGEDAGKAEQTKHELALIQAIPYQLWKKFAEWGVETGFLNQKQQGDAKDIAVLLKSNKQINVKMRNSAITIYNIICEKNIDLLLEADTITANKSATKQDTTSDAEEIVITPNVVAQMVAFNDQHKVLQAWKAKAMKKVMYGELELTDRLIHGFRLNYNELVEHGFHLQ